MATLLETCTRHATDLMNRNMPGIIGDFTPDGMASAMRLPPEPIDATSFSLHESGEGEIEMRFHGETTRTITTRWREQAPGVWKIIDVEERIP